MLPHFLSHPRNCLYAFTRAVALMVVSSFVTPFAWSQTSGAQQSKSPQPTWGELQQQINDLNSDKDIVAMLQKQNAQEIFDHTDNAANSIAEATVGTFFMHSNELTSIETTIEQANAAAKNASLFAQKSRAAAASGQQDIALQYGLNAVETIGSAAVKYKDAFDQTAKIFTRIGAGDVDPQRFWESRGYVGDGFKELGNAGHAMEQGDALSLLMNSLNSKTDQLREQQRSAPYERPTVDSPTPLTPPTLGSPETLPSTLKTNPDGSISYDPGNLKPGEKAGRDTNEKKMAAETLNKNLPSTLKPMYLPPDAQGRSFLNSTDSLKNQGQNTMYSAPDAEGNSHLISPNTDIGINDAPSGGGSLFGDISTHTSPDGLKAVPSYSACLDPITCPKRYWDKQWTIYAGGKSIAGGFGDIQLLGNGSFAATPHGGGGYQIYSGSTGNTIATDKFTQVQALDGGLVGGLGSDNQWHVMDQSGQVLGTQWADGSGTCNVLVKAGMSAFLNHGVATAPVYQSCGSYYSSSSAASGTAGAPKSTPIPSSALPQSQQTPVPIPAVGGVYLGKVKFEKDATVDEWFDQQEKKAEKSKTPQDMTTEESQTSSKPKKN